MQVAARDKVAAAAEEALGHPYGLCIEFTGLVSWTAGAAINWHHDSNRWVAWMQAATLMCAAAPMTLFLVVLTSLHLCCSVTQAVFGATPCDCCGVLQRAGGRLQRRQAAVSGRQPQASVAQLRQHGERGLRVRSIELRLRSAEGRVSTSIWLTLPNTL